MHYRRGASSQVDDSQTAVLTDETMDTTAIDSAPSPKRARREVPSISVDRFVLICK